jgi:hypothetical protein
VDARLTLLSQRAPENVNCVQPVLGLSVKNAHLAAVIPATQERSKPLTANAKTAPPPYPVALPAVHPVYAQPARRASKDLLKTSVFARKGPLLTSPTKPMQFALNVQIKF